MLTSLNIDARSITGTDRSFATCST